MPRMKFLNILIDNITMEEAIDEIDRLIIRKQNAYVVTPNVDHIVLVEKDREFREIYNNADLVLTDGQPLIWISKLFHTPIVEKVSGSDLFPKVCELASKKNYTMYFLGAGEGIAEIAAKKLTMQYPNLKILETYSPPYGFESNEEVVKDILNKINKIAPDILILALGTPKQEKFCYKYKNELNVPISLAIGASLDFMAGKVKRAPKWMQNSGLEWMYRLLKEPKRLFKRYIVNDTQILSIILKYKKINN